MSASRRCCGAVGIALTLLVACDDNSIRVTPATFERPSDLTLMCFLVPSRSNDLTRAQVTVLSACDGVDPDDSAPGRALVALVNQTARGEIGAVDLTEEEILDSDLLVPGFSFLQVDSLPSAIAVRQNATPEFVYVAGEGTSRVRAIPSTLFRRDSEYDREFLSDTNFATDGETPSEPDPVDLPGPPTDMVMGPGEDVLYVAVPSESLVAAISLAADGTFEGRVDYVLTAPASVGSPAYTKTDSSDRKLCPSDLFLLEPATADERGPFDLDLDPEPIALALDPNDHRLFVSDRQLPLIHVFSFPDDGSETPNVSQINVGVPTRELVVAPPVPTEMLASPDSDSTVQFLYAIDAVDGSVLVVELLSGTGDAQGADGAGKTDGALVLVHGFQPTDRLDLDAPALTLEILTPDDIEEEDEEDNGITPGELCDPSIEDAVASVSFETFRGVFLAAGLTDGTVRMIDIYDLDASCRGGTEAECAAGSGSLDNEDDQRVYIRRHRPRIGEFLEDDELIELSADPRYSYEGLSERINNSGLRDVSLSDPSLVPLSACGLGMTEVYPDVANLTDDGDPLICVLDDPWTTSAQQWNFEWQGAIPGTGTTVGRLIDSPEGLRFDAPGSNFCEFGVVGVLQDATAADAVSGNEGTYFVITEDSVSSDDDPSCALFEENNQGDQAVVGYTVTRATQESLELDVLEPMEAGYTLEEVFRCFPGLIEFEVRTRGSYRVEGSTEGYLTSVSEGEDGSCTQVASALPGRASPGLLFDNGFLQLQLSDFVVRPNNEDFTGLRFTVTSVPSRSGVSISALSGVSGVLPQDMRFHAGDNHLYVIDIATAGLVSIDLEELGIDAVFD